MGVARSWEIGASGPRSAELTPPLPTLAPQGGEDARDAQFLNVDLDLVPSRANEGLDAVQHPLQAEFEVAFAVGGRTAPLL